MNSSRITRSLAKGDQELRREIEAFDPFMATRLNSRGDSEEEPEEETEPRIKSKNKTGAKALVKNLDKSLPRTSRATMAVQAIPLKDVLTVVPEFNGENIPLSVFLKGCEEAKEMITDENEPHLVKIIRSKLTGEARKAIYGQAFATIGELKDVIKAIYAPAKTVHQLLGEMGNDYQRDNETVISFANRIRDLGRRIIETQRVNTGNVEARFKASIESNSVECFKRGLKTEIEQRIENSEDMQHIVENAIKAERLVEARKALGRGGGKFEDSSQHKGVIRGTYVSQIVNAEEREKVRDTFGPQMSTICQFCGKTGHTADKCRNRFSRVNSAQIVCQICNKEGHAANQCRSLIKCQVCGKQEHSARLCRSQTIGIDNCQTCGKVGHVASRCFQSRPATDRPNPQMEARSNLSCQVCKRIGHIAATCRINMNKNCNYCQTKWHTIEECRKRQYNERSRPGNGQGLPSMSAETETPQRQMRSTNFLQTENQNCKLLP